jgi:hypothetical protein
VRYERKTFTAEPIVVDDNEYLDCTFEDCSFRYSGGKMDLQRCNITGSLNLALAGAAENTARFLRLFMGNEAGRLAVASVLGMEIPSGGSH